MTSQSIDFDFQTSLLEHVHNQAESAPVYKQPQDLKAVSQNTHFYGVVTDLLLDPLKSFNK